MHFVFSVGGYLPPPLICSGTWRGQSVGSHSPSANDNAVVREPLHPVLLWWKTTKRVGHKACLCHQGSAAKLCLLNHNLCSCWAVGKNEGNTWRVPTKTWVTPEIRAIHSQTHYNQLSLTHALLCDGARICMRQKIRGDIPPTVNARTWSVSRKY